MTLNQSKAFFVVALCFASYVCGVATVTYRIFPWSVIRDADSAFRAVRATASVRGDRSWDPIEVPAGLSAPAVSSMSGAGDELILVLDGKDVRTAEPILDGTLAWIMDRNGGVKHVWRYDPEIWLDLKNVTWAPGAHLTVYPVGVHLYEDGGLLVSFHGWNCFPYGIGLARFDKDSRLLWRRELNNHHWFSVAPDGRIFCPALRVVDSPYRVGKSRARLSSPDGKLLHDEVMVLDPDGTVLDEISILDALVASNRIGLFRNDAETPYTVSERLQMVAGDPTHLNDVRLVDATVAAKHPWLNEGDLLVSLRNLNTVGILDPVARRFKWTMAGATILQHSPRFTDHGILVFDNHGGSEPLGGSQLVEIGLEARRSRAVFPHEGVPLPGVFSSYVAGHLDLADANRVLVTLWDWGRIWEIDLAIGKVVWEYIHVDHADGKGRHLPAAKYVHRPTFEFNGGRHSVR